MTGDEDGAAAREVGTRPSLRAALALRCPLCGHKPITERFGEIAPRCPSCQHVYEQGEEGYWVGALITNLAATMLMFASTVALGLALTWPAVPWGWLTGVSVAVSALFPVWFYPRSKTLWVWVDVRFLNRGMRSEP